MNSKILCLLAGVIAVVTATSNAFGQGRLPKTPPIPKNNPQSVEKIELGKQLFFDPRLSSSGTVSCNSCHNVMSGGDDSLPVSVGVEGQRGGRSAPTVWNSAFLSTMFWDGRAPSLEEQAKGPLTNPIEMGMKDHDAVMAVVKKIPGYQISFRKVFKGKNPLTIDNLAKAIASYERTLITPNSEYDRCQAGDKRACSVGAQRGLKLVQEVGCLSCHSGPNFSGPTLPEGTGFFQKFPVYPGSKYEKQYQLTKDQGRYEATKKSADKQLWRVPTWRNIFVTAPYFHNGSVDNLHEAVRVMAKTQLNKTLTDKQVDDIVAFLASLTGEFPDQKLPRLAHGFGKVIK